jgi:hypothetical protein
VRRQRARAAARVGLTRPRRRSAPSPVAGGRTAAECVLVWLFPVRARSRHAAPLPWAAGVAALSAAEQRGSAAAVAILAEIGGLGT